MPVARFQLPDGRVARFEVPEGTTPEQAQSMMANAFQPKPAQGFGSKPEDYDPTNGMSGADKFLAGMGKAVYDTGRGLGQMVGAVSRDDIAQSRKQDAPLMKNTEAQVGNLAGNVAIAAPTAMIPGANTVAGAGVAGAALGLAQPSVSTGETLANVGLGAAGGMGGQYVGNKLGQALQNRAATPALTEAQQAARDGGNAIGMQLTPGKATGNKTLQRMEAWAEARPFTSAGFDRLKDSNQSALNRATAKSIGETSNELGSVELAQASNRLSDVFERVASKDAASIPTDAAKRLAKVIHESEGMIGGNASLADNALIQRANGFMEGGATREQLRELSSKLGKTATNNMTTQGGDRALGEALFSAKEVVDDAVENSLAGVLKKEFSEARGQYRNMANLLSNTTVVNPSSGNVSGKNLAAALMRKDKGGFTKGGNTSDMYNAARFVQAFPDIVGNSGTATRSAGPTDWLLSLPTSALSHAYTSKPVVNAAQTAGNTAALIQALTGKGLTNAGKPLGIAGALAPYAAQQ